MRALGTDPIQKLVTPRLIATCTMLPLLTIIADFVGIFGAGDCLPLPAYRLAPVLEHGLARPRVERRGPGPDEAFRVRLRHRPHRLLLRPAHHRWHTGRGPRHHQAMVTASILIFILTLIIAKIFVSQAGG